MSEPMSDERLSELRHKARVHMTREVRTIPEYEARELLAEVDRLRAENDEMYRELAARPEPIGYVWADTGPYDGTSGVFGTVEAAHASRDYWGGATWRICALVPVSQ